MKGTLDPTQNIMLLETGARMSDATGSTSADHIRMDQRTGDFTAEGNVNSSRLPDKDQKKNSQMLYGDEPMHAQARKMESADHNRQRALRRSGHMWQGANRIQAETCRTWTGRSERSWRRARDHQPVGAAKDEGRRGV